MEKKQKIEAVIENLVNLFSSKDKLVGFNDWDTFIGCIMELQNVKSMIEAEEMVAMSKAAAQSEDAPNEEL